MTKQTQKQENFFKKLIDLINTRRVEWDECGKLDLTYHALEFLTESGELGEQVKKHIRTSNGLKGNTTDITKIKEEVGDVVITLCILCDLLGIDDIEQATIDKFNKTSAKYDFKTIWQ